MDKFKILMYLGVGIMLFHLISGLKESKYDFSTLGSLLVAIGYFRFEMWYIFYVVLFVLIIIELYNDIIVMTSFSKPSSKNTQPPPKSKVAS